MGIGGLIRGRLARSLALTLVPWGASAVMMEMVTVGDANNPWGLWAGSGSVGYTYQIGRFEVMNSQYAEFLNAVAGDDTYGLYNTNMTSDVRGGIARSGSSGSYVYSLKENMGEKPVNFVSFFDVARFVNWLENGQPAGPQGAGTTETGGYTISISGSATNVSDRAINATWVIPAAHEWHKAAYYDPGPTGPRTVTGSTRPAATSRPRLPPRMRPATYPTPAAIRAVAGLGAAIQVGCRLEGPGGLRQHSLGKLCLSVKTFENSKAEIEASHGI